VIVPSDFNLWTVPRIWPGETVVITACGPSLTAEQVADHSEDCRMIAISDSYKLNPKAHILYSCDARWWQWHKNALDFRGVRIGLAWNKNINDWNPGWKDHDRSNIFCLAGTGETGLESDPQGLRTGGNSGYQAINLAVHLGAKRIILLGYDMQPDPAGRHHFFGDHPGDIPPPPYDLFIEPFRSLVDPLKELKIDVINCTPSSALDCFPAAKLEEAV